MRVHRLATGLVAAVLAGVLTAQAEASAQASVSSADRMDAAVRMAAGLAAPGKKAKVTPLRTDSKGRAVVYVEGANADALRKAVAAAGGEVSDVDRQRVRAAVPPGALAKLAGENGVREVRRPETPVEMEIISEGAQPSGALNWHSTGRQGAGVKAGVIDIGFARLDEAQANGEVPAGTTVYNGLCGADHRSSHGTTMAEVVHDMAPQAQLYLACITDSMDFDDAARWLKDQGVTVVSLSLGFPGVGRGSGVADPSEGDWTPATTVAWLRQQGVLVVAAAGNEADKHMTGLTADPENNGWMNISGPAENQGFTLPAGAEATVELKWDAWPRTNHDLDLFVMDQLGKPVGLNDPHLVGHSLRWQKETPGGLSPVETVKFTATSTGTFWVYVQRKEGAATNLRYDLTVYGNVSGLAYFERAGSIAEPASSPYVLAVGAITPASAASGGAVADYSSRGPSIDGRIKPDVTGFTGVSTLIGGTKSGTSVAAAHVAGAAALYKSTNPALDPSQLEALLLDSSSRPSRDSVFGYGVLNLGSPRGPQPPAGSAFTPLQTYRRVLNTTDGTGGKTGPLGPGETFTLRITSLPDDTSAVVLNLTGLSATEPTSFEVFASTSTGATTLPLNPNSQGSVMAVVTLDPVDKVVRIRNSKGQAQLIADLVGYFSTTSSASTFTAAQRPVRLPMASPVLQPGQANTRTIPVRGVSGIPAGVTAVMVSVTATEGTDPTHVRLFSRDWCCAWTFNPKVAEPMTYTYMVAVADDGAIRIANDVGLIKVAVDVVGWFAPGEGARYVPLRYPEPVASSVTGTEVHAKQLSNLDTRRVQVTNRPRIPGNATGAVLSLSAPRADARKTVSLWATEYGWSGAPSLGTERVTPDAVPMSNTVVTPLGASGAITMRADAGTRPRNEGGTSTDVTVDIAGYFVGGQAAAPAPTPAPNGHWKFNEGNGTIVADASGNNHPVTLRSGAGWITDGVESAAGKFDGVASHATTDSPVIRTDQSYTVSAWARLTDATDWRNVVSQDGNTVSAFYLEYLKGANRWGFLVAPTDTAGVNGPFAQSVTEPALNEWTHLTGVYDATARELRLFVNGELEGTASNVSAFNASGPLHIGHFKWPNQQHGAHFAGGIDDVRTYQAALTGTQVRDLFAAVPPPPVPTGPAGSFLEITTGAELIQWTHNGNGFTSTFRDTNWGGANLITRFPGGDFLETKNGELVEWVHNGKSWTRIPRDTGWAGARLITALDHDRFLEVRNDGSLSEWRWTLAGYRRIVRDTGWGNARQIAGQCGGNFLEVKGNELIEWRRNATGGFTRVPRDTGWSDARLIARLTCSGFVQVKDNGELFEWTWNGSGYSGTRRDTGWGNARLLG